MRNIENLLGQIYVRSGISMSLFSRGGEQLCRFGDERIQAYVPRDDEFDGNVAVNPELNVTCLRIDGEYQYVLFNGSGSTEKNYALMLDAFVSGDDERFEEETGEEEKLRLLLTGEMSHSRVTVMRARHNEESSNHFVLMLVARTHEMQKQLKTFLVAIAGKNDYIVTMDERTLLFFCYDNGEGEYKNAREFACVLCENIREELRIKFKAATPGIVRTFDELCSCYEKAVFTMSIGKRLSPDEDVYVYNDYLLLKLLSEMPREILAEQLSTLLEHGKNDILTDDELMKTAQEFMKNSLNISETSRNMYVHRNTLIYRLDKIEKETGLNLRNFSDAMSFRLIEILNTLIKGE